MSKKSVSSPAQKTKFLVVMASKGGVGKTTLTHAVASLLTAQGRDVAVVDQDPQRTAYDWAMAAVGMKRPLPYPTLLPQEWLESELTPDWVIIDTPGNNPAVIQEVLKYADIILMPTMPGAIEIAALHRTLGIIGQSQFKPTVKIGIVANAWQSRGVLYEQSSESIAKVGLPIVAQLNQKAAYRKVFGQQVPFVLYFPLIEGLKQMEVL